MPREMAICRLSCVKTVSGVDSLDALARIFDFQHVLAA